jgi:hypothetical protein
VVAVASTASVKPKALQSWASLMQYQETRLISSDTVRYSISFGGVDVSEVVVSTSLRVALLSRISNRKDGRTRKDTEQPFERTRSSSTICLTRRTALSLSSERTRARLSLERRQFLQGRAIRGKTETETEKELETHRNCEEDSKRGVGRLPVLGVDVLGCPFGTIAIAVMAEEQS